MHELVVKHIQGASQLPMQLEIAARSAVILLVGTVHMEILVG